MYCKHCGATVNDNAVVCVNCGCAIQQDNQDLNVSPKSWTAALLLCLFCGTLGVHRFYAGKIGTGILQLLTLGCCGFWTLIDLIIIICENFKDSKGLVIRKQ